MKKNKAPQDIAENIKLDIPEEEIWTYHIEGLAAPHINKPYDNAKVKKIFFVIAILIAISCSIYFSMRAVDTDTITYTVLEDGTTEWTKFTNTGDIEEISIDYYTIVEFEEDENTGSTKTILKKDENNPISSVHEFAFNGDNVLKKIIIGKDVKTIDNMAFYSCSALREFEVSEENENYCDIDGVLYTKDKTKIICVPQEYRVYLMEKFGYEVHPENTDEMFPQFQKDVLTYVVAPTVKEIAPLCFNYTFLNIIYLPEGLEKVGTLAFFKSGNLSVIDSYTPDENGEFNIENVKKSIPSTVTTIESDAFSYTWSLEYFYIPQSVTYIGHHAFWDSKCSDRDDTSENTGIHIEMSEEEFSKIELGQQWYNKTYFSKKPCLVFGEERLAS